MKRRLLTSSQFDQALVYARLNEANANAAFLYVVKGISSGQISRDMKCTRQNVNRVAKVILKAYDAHLESQHREAS